MRPKDSKAQVATAAVKRVPAPRGAQLRVAHVWRDEVMADCVFIEPSKVTLGTTQGSTFTIPDLGLPDGFTFLRPGRRGYVLTLGASMAGRLRLGDDEMDVAEFLSKKGDDRAAGSAGRFHATAVNPGDWGVVELEDGSEHNVFFQFVPGEEPLPRPRWSDSNLLVPALCFALILHTVFLALFFVLPESGNNLIFPGNRELMARYLVRRPPPPPEPVEEQAASPDGDEEDVNSGSKGDEGKAGGEGDEPIAQDPDGVELPKNTPEVFLLDKKARKTIQRITMHRAVDDALARSLNRLGPRVAGGLSSGKGSGSGLGDLFGGTGTKGDSNRDGTGAGGSAEKLFVARGKIDAGDPRAPKGKGKKGARKEAKVAFTGGPQGDFGKLTKEEINRVIRSKRGYFRACYQNALNRTSGIGGRVVVKFYITPTGAVQSNARVVGPKSTLRNTTVQSCIVRQIKRLKFPAKGRRAVVDYPFIFQQG